MRNGDRFDAVFEAARDAYSPATLRGYRADLHIYAKWCAQRKRIVFPAKPAVVAEFVDAQIDCALRVDDQAPRLCHRLCACDARFALTDDGQCDTPRLAPSVTQEA